MLVINCTVMIILILLVIETIDRCDSQALLWQEDKEGTEGELSINGAFSTSRTGIYSLISGAKTELLTSFVLNPVRCFCFCFWF